MNMEDLYRLMRTGHMQAQGIVDTVSYPLIVLDRNLCIQGASRSFFQTFKVDRYETIGQQIYDLGNGQWDIPELRRLLTDVIPKSAAIIDYEVEHDFPGIGRKVMLVTARTLHHPDNGSHSMLLTFVDATASTRRDAAKDMLFNELRHRMKNLLAVAHAIARQTPAEGRSAEDYRDDFMGRFGALVEAQDLAFNEQKKFSLETLIERILAPYITTPDAITVEPGMPIELSPSKVMSVSLVLHELATNAVKYGPLSISGGTIRIAWQVDAENQLLLTWVESGGPPVTPPATTGYGTQLIQSVVSYSLGGDVEQNYAAGGLEAKFIIPLDSASRQADG